MVVTGGSGNRGRIVHTDLYGAATARFGQHRQLLPDWFNIS